MFRFRERGDLTEDGSENQNPTFTAEEFLPPLLGPAHQVDGPLHDRLEFPARHAGTGTDRDRVDGGGCKVRQRRRVGALRQLAALLGMAEADAERLVELG